MKIAEKNLKNSIVVCIVELIDYFKVVPGILLFVKVINWSVYCIASPISFYNRQEVGCGNI